MPQATPRGRARCTGTPLRSGFPKSATQSYSPAHPPTSTSHCKPSTSVKENAFSGRCSSSGTLTGPATSRVFHDEGTNVRGCHRTHPSTSEANPSNAVFTLQGIMGNSTIFDELKVGYNAAQTNVRIGPTAELKNATINLTGSVGQHRHRRQVRRRASPFPAAWSAPTARPTARRSPISRSRCR